MAQWPIDSGRKKTPVAKPTEVLALYRKASFCRRPSVVTKDLRHKAIFLRIHTGNAKWGYIFITQMQGRLI